MTRPDARTVRRHGPAARILLLALTVAATTMPLYAERPGRGLTAHFEVNYLKFIIDHHFSALRMTELAAGTDETRSQAISPTEGTAPSPDFPPTAAHSKMDDIKSMAREANRVQREEILRAQGFLKKWYGITYQPKLTAEGRQGIDLLEGYPPGSGFDHKFLEVFSHHHYPAIQRSVDCVIGSDLEHDELKRYCRNIIETQMNGIEDMRHMLCASFGVCDFEPFETVDGNHS